MITKKERFYKILKKSNLNVTPQRMEVLSFLENTDTHPSALDVWNYLKKVFPSISKTTVYNILDAFVKLKILKVIHTDNTLKYDFNLKSHAHFVCTVCGRIDDIDLEKIFYKEPLIEFEINEVEIYLRGLCKKCGKEIKSDD